MNSALLVRNTGIVPQFNAADYTAKRGYLVTLSGGIATLSASATVPATGIILEPHKTAANYATEYSEIGILGAFDGTCRVKTSGAITAGARVMQAADGTVVTDAGPGTARVVVGIALEDAASGDLIEIAPLAPMILP